MKSISLNIICMSSSALFSLLLTACGGGSGGDGSSSNDFIFDPPPPSISPQPWTGPKKFLLTKPETGNNPTAISISEVDGAVMLDGVVRKFQARAVSGGDLVFSAGAPWLENPAKTLMGMLALDGNRVNSIEYPDSQSRADIGTGASNSTVAVRDFITLCSPGKHYSLINADAKRLFSDSLPLFFNRTLQGSSNEFNTCSDKVYSLYIDATGSATISRGYSNGFSPELETLSATQLQSLAAGNSLLMPDGEGMRSIVIHQFNDTSGSRLAIQEFARYPDSRKNYIRIWY